MTLITGTDGKQYDTNNQSDRDQLRDQGHYIDNSGVYAPGSGQRIGSTWSGTNAGKNEAPSPTQLPIVNGTPVSPSNGATGPQTGAIMYRSDPQYASLFGPGTPGYSATSRQANAAPLPAQPGQQSLADWLIQQGVHAPVPARPVPTEAPAPASPDSTTMGPMIPGGPPEDQTNGSNVGPPPADDAPATAPPPASPSGYNPNDIQWNQPRQPASTGQVNPNQATSNPNAGQPGQNSTAATNAAGLADTPAVRSQQTGNNAPAGPNPNDPTQGGTLAAVQVGNTIAYVPIATRDAIIAQQNAAADAARQATQFTQGIEQQKLDMQRSVDAWNKAYQQAIIDGNNATRAQEMAIEVMREDMQKQAQEITRQANAQTAVYQMGVLENQRQASAQTLSTEREKLSLQRQQLRGRRLPAVRYA